MGSEITLNPDMNWAFDFLEQIVEQSDYLKDRGVWAANMGGNAAKVMATVWGLTADEVSRFDHDISTGDIVPRSSNATGEDIRAELVRAASQFWALAVVSAFFEDAAQKAVGRQVDNMEQTLGSDEFIEAAIGVIYARDITLFAHCAKVTIVDSGRLPFTHCGTRHDALIRTYSSAIDAYVSLS